MNKKLTLAIGVPVVLALSLTGCAAGGQVASTNATNTTATSNYTSQAGASVVDRSGQRLTDADISTQTNADNSANGEHAITADGKTASYANCAVNKTGDSDGDNADFYGDNAAIFATNSATLTLADMIVATNGKHANGVFSYGSGTTLNIAHSIIRTTGNCSGGLMTTGGGIMNATDVTAETTGNSSAAIRSDRGGGTVNVTGGYFTTSGSGSPAIYSTADITVNRAYLRSDSSQGVVVEGKNSVTLNDSQLIASNTAKSSDKSEHYQAVMIYQSMSGDASTGTSSFSMSDGSLTNNHGDIFFVNNTSCEISLSSATITNNDVAGNFLRAAAAGWGSSGSNGGKVNLKASGQVINGNMLVDDISTLNFYGQNRSAFTGAINPDGQKGSVYVELDANSIWTLTADSYVSSLTCAQGTVNLNGHKLFVNGAEYDGSSANTGTSFEIVSASIHGGKDGGAGGDGGGAGGSAPDKPSNKGDGSGGGSVPDKPNDNGSGGNGGNGGGNVPDKPNDNGGGGNGGSNGSAPGNKPSNKPNA